MSLFQTLRAAYRETLTSKPVTFWREYGRFGWMPISAAIDITYSEDTAPPLLGNIAGIGAALALRHNRGIWPWVIPMAAYAVGRGIGYAAIGKSPFARRGETIKARIADTVLASNVPNVQIISDANTIEGLSHTGLAGETRRENTDFGSGYVGLGKSVGLGLSLGVAGASLYGWKGGAVGGLIGAGLGYSISKIQSKLENREKGSAGRAITTGIATAATIFTYDAISDTFFVGLARGGLLWPEKLADRAAKTWFGRGFEKLTGRSAASATGLTFKFADLFRNMNPESRVGRIFTPLVKMANPVLLNPALVDVLESTSGLSKLNKLEYIKRFGENTLKGIPFLAVTGLLGAGLSYLKNRRNKAPNEFNGLQESGVSSERRKRETDFGSGYRADDPNKRGRLTSFAIAGGVSAGVGFSFGMHYSFMDTGKYPRLQKLQDIGARAGLRTVSMSFPDEVDQAFSRKNFFTKLALESLQGPLNPTKDIEGLRGFKGLIYMRDVKKVKGLKNQIGTGRYELGVDKLSTWRYLKRKGAEDLHAYSITGTEFMGNRRAAGRFLERVGGLSNVVVKERTGSLGEGVWLDASKLPAEVSSLLTHEPENFLLQQRLDLAGEFRTITVGGKNIYSAHRFGPKWLEDLLPSRMSENIIPVLDPKVRQGLVEFSESVAKHLPYDIGAMDIGLTKAGQFKLIEAQRQFGSISIPFVSGRMRNILTKRPGGLAIGATAIAGLSAYLLARSNKAPNAIKGHDKGHWGREQTFKDGDFEPGSSWIKDAIKRGVAWDKIGKAALELRAPSKELLQIVQTSRLEQLYASGGTEAVTKAIRSLTTLRVEGKSYALGRQIGTGSFKDVTEVFATGHIRGAVHAPGEKFIWSELSQVVIEPIQANAPVYTTPFLRSSISGAVGGKIAPEAADQFVSFYENTIRGNLGQYNNNAMAAEVAAQRMGHRLFGDVVPDVIAANERGFLQEFGGTHLGDKYNKIVHSKIQKVFNTMMAQSGEHLVHFDLHPGNILRKGGKLRIVDWGLAAPGMVTPELTETSQKLSNYYMYLKTRDQIIPQTRQTIKGLLDSKATLTVEKTQQGTLRSMATTTDLHELFRKGLEQKLQLVQQDMNMAEQMVAYGESGGTRGKSVKMKMDVGQQLAQPLPFEMHDVRRRSHGRTRTKK